MPDHGEEGIVELSRVPSPVSDFHSDREEDDALAQEPEPGLDGRAEDGDGDELGRHVERDGEAHADGGGEALD